MQKINDWICNQIILIPHINKENNDNQTDEKYQKILIDDKESNEKYQIIKNDAENIIEDIEITKLQNLSSKKKNWGKIWQNKFKGYEWQQGLWWKIIDK